MVGVTSLFGGVYGWVISQFQLNGKMHPIKIFGGFYALAFGIIISISIFISFLESLFSWNINHNVVTKTRTHTA